MKNVFRDCALGLIVAFILLVCFELVLRGLGFHFALINYESRYTQAEPIYNETADGFRVSSDFKNLPIHFIPHKKPGEFRVVLVGGSTVGLMVSDRVRDKLQSLIRKKVSVVNFGIATYGSVRLLSHFSEIMRFAPDLIFVYMGENEFEEDLLRPESQSKLIARAITVAEKSRVFQYVSWLIYRAGNFLMYKNLKALQSADAPLFPRTVRLAENPPNKDSVYHAYEQNLRRMVSLARINQVPMVLSTFFYNRMSEVGLPLNLPSLVKAKSLYAQKKYVEAKELFELAQEENMNIRAANRVTVNITKKVAADLGVPLFDADKIFTARASHGISGPEMFADHVHLKPIEWLPVLEDEIVKFIAALSATSKSTLEVGRSPQ